MLKLLRNIIVILLIPAFAYAGGAMGLMMVGGTTTSTPTCNTETDSALFDKVASGTTVDSTKIVGTKFVLAADSTITGYVIRGCDANQTGTIRASIFTHNGGTNLPDTEVSGTNISVDHSSITNCTTKTNDVYTLAATKTLSAGTYWIVRTEEGGNDHQAVYHASSGDRTCYGAITCNTGTDNFTYDMAVYGCTP